MSTDASPYAVRTRQIYGYFVPLTLLVYMALPDGYLLDIATSFMLKNQLHASASEVSRFRLLTALPIYCAFLFGIARDRWSLWGLRDRGFFLIFAPICTLTLLWMAFSPISNSVLLVGMFLLTMSFRFISAAYQGLLALIGQEKQMSGRLSAVYNFGSYSCYVAGAFASGYVTEHLSPRQIFMLAAALTAAITAAGLWAPREVFRHSYSNPQAMKGDFLGDLKRLAKHRAVYPAVLVTLVYNISPSFGTPMQFYLTNELQAPDSAYANYFALNMAGYLPGFLLYGVACKRISLDKLLWWSTFLAIPALLPLPWAHSTNIVLLLGLQAGLMNGIAQAAYIDLALRSCPAGLQGTLMMMVIGVWGLAARAGDVLGSWIYSSFPGHGILYCVLTATAMSALVLPLLLLVPQAVIETMDGVSDRKPARKSVVTDEFPAAT